MRLNNFSKNPEQWKQWIYGRVRVLYVLYIMPKTKTPNPDPVSLQIFDSDPAPALCPSLPYFYIHSTD